MSADEQHRRDRKRRDNHDGLRRSQSENFAVIQNPPAFLKPSNSVESKLGTTPLPDGIVRVFRDNGRDGLSYLTQQSIKYIPIGDKIELNLGPDPEVVFDLIKQRTWRDTIWMQLHGVNVFRRIDGPGGVAVEANSSIAGWNDHHLRSSWVMFLLLGLALAATLVSE